MSDSLLFRRRFLGIAGAAALAPLASHAVTAKPPTGGSPYVIAQVVDISMEQQDVSKDILVGARTAWQEINSLGGIQGREIRHTVFEVDGTPQSIQEALAAISNNPRCIAISATSGERTALEMVTQLRKANLTIANVAPWLQDSTVQIEDRTFPIFASRQEQISFALRELNKQGVRELAAVYATQQDLRQYRADIENTAQNLKLNLRTFEPTGDVGAMGKLLVPGSPVVVLFVGGTPEIISFLQGADTLRQRYIIALADVNLQTLAQLGSARKTSVLGTQVVPVLSNPLPIVRRFKAALTKQFDEPPTALSLAGFISAQYTSEVLKTVDGELTRSKVLGAFQTRSVIDVGGFRVRAGKTQSQERFVVQSLLTADGRIIS